MKDETQYQYQYEFEYIIEHADGTTDYASLSYPNTMSYDEALAMAENELDTLNVSYTIYQVYESPIAPPYTP